MVYPRLQFLTLDASPHSHREQARLALEGGVQWIQLRVKNLPEPEWIQIAQDVAHLCKDFGATLIIKDSSVWTGAKFVLLGVKRTGPTPA